MITDFFANDAECTQSVSHAQCDMRAEHGKFLGKSVGDLVRDFEKKKVMLSSCSGPLSHELVSRGGSIVMTAAGALGDSGFGNPRLVFHLDGEQRERYVGDEGTYEALRLSRSVFRRARRPVLSNSPWFIAMNHTVDNRELIPPMFPFGRNSDGLLGILLRACRPDAYIMYLPFGIRHIPPAPRMFSESDMRTYSPRVCDFMGHIAQMARLNPLMRSTADRVTALAAVYRSLGSLPIRDFEEATRSAWMSFADRYVLNLEDRLEQYAYKPEKWAADIEAYVGNLLEFLRSPAPLIPREHRSIGAAGDAESQLEAFRQSVRLFGEALDAWPTLREIVAQHPLI